MGDVVVDLTMTLDGLRRHPRGPDARRDPGQCRPLLLGGGVRLFDHLGPEPIVLEQTRVLPSDGVTHLRYRVVRD
jgi:hypothetical protein